ncbi:AGAP011106-PA, partial [Anopheles gambiae str. PEST]
MSKFLSLRRPTTISKLAPFVPQHPDALPREIVPQWADLLPSAKLPDRCCPVHAKDLSRGALGQPVWELPPEHGFDLQDPELRVVRRSYLELHDKHLREFWTEALKKYLKRRELINNEERVMCTLRQLNQYRSFLFQRYRLQLKRLLQKLGSDKAMDDHNAKVQTHMETVPDFEEKLFIRRNRAAGIYSKKMDGWKQTVE